MKAVRINEAGGLAGVSYEEIPTPQPAAGEVLVQVYASGVSPTEIYWASSTGKLRPLPATLGFEVSGVVVALGEGVTDLSIGAEVYGLPPFTKGGTHAEYVVINAHELALKPRSITHVEAAAVPLSGLTAWQALFEQGQISAGQTVLIHGAAGGVGIFAVQLAHWAGAKVIATASERNRDFLIGLGADEVIAYNTSKFEEIVGEVDVVFDTIGADTLERSWQIVKKGGVVVSVGDATDAQMQAKASEWGVRATWMLVKPNREQLSQLAELIDAGKVKPQVEKIYPLAQGIEAYTQGLKGHNRGKLVLQIVN
jgi:NADPH:quinone reductase-like Zn-dependent oxidoreductase